MENDYFTILQQDYVKILRLNTTNNTFKEIKVNPEEHVNYSGINQWFIEFMNNDLVADEDKARFLKFASISNIKEILKTQKCAKLVYRRGKKDKKIWAIMKIFKTNIENELLLTVRNLEEDYDEIKNFLDVSTEESLAYKINQLSKNHVGLGVMIIEFKPEDEEEIKNVLNYYYYPYYEVEKYNNNHYILYTIDLPRDECYKLLVQAYKNFVDVNVAIGAAWRESDWNFIDIMIELGANLQINQEEK